MYQLPVFLDFLSTKKSSYLLGVLVLLGAHCPAYQFELLYCLVSMCRHRGELVFSLRCVLSVVYVLCSAPPFLQSWARGNEMALLIQGFSLEGVAIP